MHEKSQILLKHIDEKQSALSLLMVKTYVLKSWNCQIVSIFLCIFLNIYLTIFHFYLCFCIVSHNFFKFEYKIKTLQRLNSQYLGADMTPTTP